MLRLLKSSRGFFLSYLKIKRLRSILSLVQDFNIDYDVTVSGEKFIDIVIDHLDERDFLLDYAKKLEKAYLKVNPKRTQNLIVQEILLRQDIISNIEKGRNRNYVLF